jgi:hypothetical protein
VRGSPPALLLSGALLAAGLARAPSARADAPAEEAPSIFVVIATPEDRFGQRVIAELSSLGFQGIRLDPPDPSASRVGLEAAARGAGALAAIRAVRSARGVEVWIADRVTGKTVLREIAIDAGAPDPESALVIQTVELLRASLLEVSLPGPPPGEVPATAELRKKLAVPALAAPEEEAPPPAAPAPAAPAAPVEEAPRAPPPKLRASLAPGALFSPGGFAPAAALDLGVAWMPSDRVGLMGFASIPLTRPQVSGAAGSAELATTLAGGGVRFVFTDRSSAWDPSLDMGLTAISMQLTASAGAGFRAIDAGAWTAAPFLRLGLAFAVSPMLRLRADVLATGAFQGVTVNIAQEEVATFGEPIVVTSAGVDFGWL